MVKRSSKQPMEALCIQEATISLAEFMAGADSVRDAVLLGASRMRDTFFKSQVEDLVPMMFIFGTEMVFGDKNAAEPKAMPPDHIALLQITLARPDDAGRAYFGQVWAALTSRPTTMAGFQVLEGYATMLEDPAETPGGPMVREESLFQIITAGGWIQTRIHPFKRNRKGIPGATRNPVVRDVEPSESRSGIVGRMVGE